MALRVHGLVVVAQLPVGVAALLPTPVGVDEQAGRRRLRPKSALQGTGNELLRHRGTNLPAKHLLVGHILVCAQICPVAISQRQVRSTDPDSVALSGLGLVEEQVRCTAQAVRGVGGARGIGLGLQRVQGPSAHGCA